MSSTGRIERVGALCARRPIATIVVWVLLAGILNLLVPQLERVVHERSGPVIPVSAPSLSTWSSMGAQFGESAAVAIGYVVMEDSDGVSDADRRFYTSVLDEVSRNSALIDSVVDYSSSPMTAPIATSKDRKAVYAIVRFHGGMGSADARHGQDFVVSVLRHTSAPSGVRLYLTGPAPAIGDELQAEDRSVFLITGLSVAMIVALLLLVYRSVVALVVPLASVGLALAVARPLVGILATHAGLEVSVFSVMLLAALVLGGGTDYAIFMLSSYHEARRRGVPAGPPAVTAASIRTTHVVVASGLTVAASCAVMACTDVALFRTAGLPCSIGMLLAVAAALTLVPAIMALAGRRNLLEPRGEGKSTLWRRVGVLVVKRPVVVFAASMLVLVTLAAQLAWMTTGYDERAMQPSSTLSNQGYAAIARHFDPNELTADYLVIDSAHDLRNSAGFSAINAVARAIGRLPGVKEVRSIAAPEGRPLPEFSLGHQDLVIADRLTDAIAGLEKSSPRVRELSEGMTRLSAGMDRLSAGSSQARRGSGVIAGGSTKLHDGLGEASDGTRQLGSGADQLAAGSVELASSVRADVDPILGILNGLSPSAPSVECPAESVCDVDALTEPLSRDPSLIGQLRYKLVRLKVGTEELAKGNNRLANGIRQLRDGLTEAAAGSSSLAGGQQVLTTKLGELTQGAQAAKAGADRIGDGVAEIGPQLSQLTEGLRLARDYLHEAGTAVGDGPDAGFYVPVAAFDDPRLREAMGFFVSADGHQARLIVMNQSSAYDVEAIGRLHATLAAARDEMAHTILRDDEVSATGLAAGFRDLRDMTNADLILIALCALAFIFVILTVLLRALLAPLFLIATIALSYLSALGLSVVVWQYCLGIDIYTAVPALAFVALVAVGSDYNIMLMSRIRAESGQGINTGILRAFRSTGGVVSTAGVIFAMTMLAMLASPVTSISQVGFTIGAGLLVDTFIVRALTVPAITALLGRRSWWPSRQASAMSVGHHELAR